MSSFEFDPVLSRREAILAGIAFGLGVAGLTACTDSGPQTHEDTTEQMQQAYALTLRNPTYTERAADLSQDPVFRAATGTMFTEDPTGKSVNAGTAFLYYDQSLALKIGTVAHVGRESKAINGKVSYFFGGIQTLLLPASQEQMSFRAVDASDDGLTEIIDTKTTDALQALVKSDVLRPLQIATGRPVFGETVRIPNIRRGAYEQAVYCGELFGSDGLLRPMVILQVVLDQLGVLAPKAQLEYDNYISRISSGEGNIAALIDRFICSGDSGTPILNATNQVVGVTQSINLTVQNDLGQMCSPNVSLG